MPWLEQEPSVLVATLARNAELRRELKIARETTEKRESKGERKRMATEDREQRERAAADQLKRKREADELVLETRKRAAFSALCKSETNRLQRNEAASQLSPELAKHRRELFSLGQQEAQSGGGGALEAAFGSLSLF